MSKKNKASKKASKAVETVVDTVVAETPVKEPKAGKKGKGKGKPAKELKLAHDKPKMSKAAIEKRIVTKLEAETKTTIEIGVLLEQAKFYFYKGKTLKGALHIDWCGEHFGFKKAQVHKYIKIGKVFGEMEGFDGVPMGVLAQMSSDNDILTSALADMKAAKKDGDEAFKIDNVWLKGYNEKLEGEKQALLEQEDITLAEQLEAMSLEDIRVLYKQLTGEDAGKKQEKGLRSKIANFSDEDIEKALFDIDAAAKAELDANATVKKAKFDKVEAELAVKQAELEAQATLLEEAQANQGGGDGAELMNARDKALHKLMSKQAAHVLLGVASDANKRDVNKAKRALEPIYSPKHDHGCESIWTLIETAATELTA